MNRASSISALRVFRESGKLLRRSALCSSQMRQAVAAHQCARNQGGVSRNPRTRPTGCGRCPCNRTLGTMSLQGQNEPCHSLRPHGRSTPISGPAGRAVGTSGSGRYCCKSWRGAAWAQYPRLEGFVMKHARLPRRRAPRGSHRRGRGRMTRRVRPRPARCRRRLRR